MRLQNTAVIITILCAIFAGAAYYISSTKEPKNTPQPTPAATHTTNNPAALDTSTFVQRARSDKGEDLLTLLAEYKLDERKNLLSSIPDHDIPRIYEKMCIADTSNFKSLILNPMDFSELVDIFWRWQSQKPMISRNFKRQDLFEDPLQFQFNIRKYLTICERVVMQVLTQHETSSKQ
ncbi:hypothetical protein ACFL2V_17520 [Pseudomonadota bacterium]